MQPVSIPNKINYENYGKRGRGEVRNPPCLEIGLVFSINILGKIHIFEGNIMNKVTFTLLGTAFSLFLSGCAVEIPSEGGYRYDNGNHYGRNDHHYPEYGRDRSYPGRQTTVIISGGRHEHGGHHHHFMLEKHQCGKDSCPYDPKKELYNGCECANCLTNLEF